MSEISAGRPVQPKIASFAPELIDEILHHLVADLERSPDLYPGPKGIGEYALVSQNWRGSVQRRLFSRLIITSGTQAERIAEDFVASGLDIYVKDLTIIFSHALVDEPTSDQIKAVDAVTSDDFLALLPHFPALISLQLDGTPFTQLRPSEIVKVQSSPIFPHLTILCIRARNLNRDADLVHAILSSTRSITTLALYSGGDRTDKNPSTRSPVTLPHLQSLILTGRAYVSSFLDLGLLSSDTIAQVERLYWSDDASEYSSAHPLLQVLGPTLRFLRYTTFRGGSRDVAAELQSCAVLEELDLRLSNGVPQGLLRDLPPTLHTLAFQNMETAHDVLVDDFASRSPSLKTVRLDADYDWTRQEKERDWWQYNYERARFEEIIETLKNTGVELVVTGKGLLKELEEILQELEEMA